MSIFYKATTVSDVATGILTPLEAAEAMLNGEDLLYLNYLSNWVEAGKSLDYSLKFLSKEKFKRKPKIVTINGVEVVAPMSLKEVLECRDRREGYVIELAQRKVYSKRILQGQIVWATEEDAQKALDAILIPFKE